MALVFDNIRYAAIEEPEYYFNTFWQIYTWNALLLCPEFEEIREKVNYPIMLNHWMVQDLQKKP